MRWAGPSRSPVPPVEHHQVPFLGVALLHVAEGLLHAVRDGFLHAPAVGDLPWTNFKSFGDWMLDDDTTLNL